MRCIARHSMSEVMRIFIGKCSALVATFCIVVQSPFVHSVLLYEWWLLTSAFPSERERERKRESENESESVSE